VRKEIAAPRFNNDYCIEQIDLYSTSIFRVEHEAIQARRKKSFNSEDCAKQGTSNQQAEHSYKSQSKFYQTMRRHIPRDITLQIHPLESLKSNISEN
jgi:hypothetical protein